MDLWLSFGIGLLVYGAGLYDKRWAVLLSVSGFIPFLLAGISGILGLNVDVIPVANTPAGMDAYGIRLLGIILSTYVAGVIMGWLPHFITCKTLSKTGE